MQSAGILEAEAAIIKQVNIFFTSLDERDYDRMAATMTKTGVWHRGGIELVGPEGLLAEMAKRPVNRHTRHVLTNLVPEVSANGSAILRFYSTAWVYVGDMEDKGVAPLDTPHSIGVYTARFLREDETWKISDLRSEPAFRRAK